jgi:hypothetical protein
LTQHNKTQVFDFSTLSNYATSHLFSSQILAATATLVERKIIAFYKHNKKISFEAQLKFYLFISGLKNNK